MEKNGGRFGPFWDAYGEALTSTEAVASYVTVGLAACSWGVESVAGDTPYGAVAAVVVGWAGALAGGLVIARGAVTGLLAREVNVDELVTLAIAAALYSGEYLGAALVAFMMLFGKVLEDVTAARADNAIAGLGRLVPPLAHLVREGVETDVAVEDVAPGDVVNVRPGERVPVDGTIASGRAWVDEAAITGEASPASRGPGDTAFAGTLVSGGALTVTVARTGEATTLGRIAALVAEATEERAPVVRTADRWAMWFTPGVLALAAVTWAFTGAFDHAVAVLVAACPCALTLATPTAIVATVARAARHGILVRGGARVEASGTIDVVCLDKTGTLTTGTPTAQAVHVFGDWTAEDVLRHAAAIEARSEHPLARAICSDPRVQDTGVVPETYDVTGFIAAPGNGVVGTVHGFTEAGRDARGPTAAATTRAGQSPDAAGPPPAPLQTHPLSPTSLSPAGGETEAGRDARGPMGRRVAVGRPAFVRASVGRWEDALDGTLAAVEASGQTPVVVAVDGAVAGVIALGDTVRPDAAEAVAALRRRGVTRVLLLTGDAPGPAHAVAAAVGIPREDVRAGLLPEGKVDVVRRLVADGHRVAMVGDGVNDAPALGASHLGVAMGAGATDLAMAAADVVLLRNRLTDVAQVIGMGRDAMRTIWQNLVVAAGWNVVAVGAAAGGFSGIVAGALIHNVGSVGVVVNAARLVGSAGAAGAPPPAYIPLPGRTP
jgi:cation transport ATPase